MIVHGNSIDRDIESMPSLVVSCWHLLKLDWLSNWARIISCTIKYKTSHSRNFHSVLAKLLECCFQT